MNKFDAPSDSNLSHSRDATDEKAVIALLKAPALSYTRELRQAIDKDPNFLAFHDQSIGLIVQNLLSKQGIFWDQEVFEKEYMTVVNEAVIRVRCLDM